MKEVYLAQDFLLDSFPGYRDLVGSALLVAMDTLGICYQTTIDICYQQLSGLMKSINKINR